MRNVKILLFGMAICLSNGLKAQFYDSADDIYYYVEEYYEYEESRIENKPFLGPQLVYTGKMIKKYPDPNHEIVKIFNFDGNQAAELTNIEHWRVKDIKEILKNNPNCYEEKVETTDYIYKYISSSSGIIYKNTSYENGFIFMFSSDRNKMTMTRKGNGNTYFKRVDKNYFKVGRSRTPNNTLHE